jgi:hypothetical protein
VTVRVSVKVIVHVDDWGPAGPHWNLTDQENYEAGDNPRFLGGEVSRLAEVVSSRVRAQVDTRFGTTAEVS